MMGTRAWPQLRDLGVLAAIALALWLTTASALAGEFVAVEVGSSGEILPNHAYHQPKHYLKQDQDLLGRIACLTDDMDSLLASLHAQPAELAGSDIVNSPADEELGALFALALDNNPGLAPLRSRLAAQAARTRQEGAKPDPMLGLELDDMNSPLPVIRQAGDTRVRVMLSQEFESYGKRGLRREIAHREEDLLELERKQKELELLLELTEAYYNLAGSRAQLRSLDQNIKLMGVLIELANRKYSVGLTPLAAVMAAQVEQSKMEAMRIELRNLASQQEVRIEGLLGRPAAFKAAELKFDAPYPLPPHITWDNHELLPEVLACRPDYQLFDSKLEQQELQLELALREYRPDYTLSAEYSVSAQGQDSLMAAVEIPLFTHKEESQDARVQEVHAEQAETEDERTALENSLLSDLETFQYELQMHAELVELYRKGLVPQSRLALDSNIAAYSANMMDLSDLIMSQQTLLSQEQALEENYIHILHTLTDLQIVTCGVFDPASYLQTSADSTGEQPAAAPLDLANQAIAEVSQISESLLEEAWPLLPPAMHSDSEPAETGEVDRNQKPGAFIDRLKLPQRSSQHEAATAAPDGTPPQGNFYQPFVPGDSGKGDEVPAAAQDVAALAGAEAAPEREPESAEETDTEDTSTDAESSEAEGAQGGK